MISSCRSSAQSPADWIFQTTTQRSQARCSRVSRTLMPKNRAVFGWGQFLTVTLNFLIVAWVLFMAIKGINKLQTQEPPKPPGPTPEVKLLTEIRDLLKK